ncbi:MAG: ribosome maturation factor RimM [Chlorobiota bacterium]
MGAEGRLRYIGSFVRTHGLRGGLVLRWVPEVERWELRNGQTVAVGYSAEFAHPYRIRSLRPLVRGMVVFLEGITTVEQARKLLEHGVFVEEAELAGSIQEEGWAIEDILGCTVIEEGAGQHLGTVVDVWLLPANDVWVVELETAYLPLPAIPDVIRWVDVRHRRIGVRLLPGLLEIAEPKRNHGAELSPDFGVAAD